MAILDNGNWQVLNQFSSNYIPDNSIGDLEFDIEGNLWAAVYGGLVRFDGT
jgi:ligand-binding sensor domain-containing protein